MAALNEAEGNDAEGLLAALGEAAAEEIPDCDPASWLCGSDFDLLLGGQASAVYEASKVSSLDVTMRGFAPLRNLSFCQALLFFPSKAPCSRRPLL